VTPHEVVALPGDGIGPELVAATRSVLDATGVSISWREGIAGEVAFERHGTPLPAETTDLVRASSVVLKGPFSNPNDRRYGDIGYPSPNHGMRSLVALTVNMRQASTFVPTSGGPLIDISVFRDITEDIYSGPQYMVGPDVAIGIKTISRTATERVARAGFEFARRRGSSKVTIVHKAATLKATDGLFLEAAASVAAGYPDVEWDEELVDAAAMHLVKRPQDYDVIVTTYQYGDILTDLVGGIVGSVGLVAGASYGEKCAFFEAGHGSAPKYAGLDRANPVGLILSGALLLEHLGENAAAAAVRAAVRNAVEDGAVTVDLGGKLGTREMTARIAARVAELMTEGSARRGQDAE
jgi:isocitrate dehydrogenase (NAD+)